MTGGAFNGVFMPHFTHVFMTHFYMFFTILFTPMFAGLVAWTWRRPRAGKKKKKKKKMGVGVHRVLTKALHESNLDSPPTTMRHINKKFVQAFLDGNAVLQNLDEAVDVLTAIEYEPEEFLTTEARTLTYDALRERVERGTF